MPEPSEETIQAAGEKAVSVFTGEIGAELSTGKYVILVESMDDEGRMGLIHTCGSGQRPWDTIGILAYALRMEEFWATQEE